MSDAIEDMVLARMAGYYSPGDDPDEAEVHPHAARTGNMLTVTDWIARAHRAEGRVAVLETELRAYGDLARDRNHWLAGYDAAQAALLTTAHDLGQVRALLSALAARPKLGLAIGDYQRWCAWCKLDMTHVEAEVVANHAESCPWRQAQEYLARTDGQRETK